MSTELYHHGIKGMKWGVRRYQKSDGSLTSAGKKRYSDDEPKNNKSAKTSAKKSSSSTKKQKSKSDKEDIDRMINALDNHMKAQKASVLASAAYAAARTRGYDFVVDFMQGAGSSYVRNLDISAGYNFWR